MYIYNRLDIDKLLQLSGSNSIFFAGFKYSLFFIFVLFFLMLSSTGCARKTVHAVEKKATFSLPTSNPHSDILKTSYSAADKLAEGLYIRGLSQDEPVMAASFVNIDDLNKSSTLGRAISEQIACRLAQHGFKMIEVKLRHESIFIKKHQGEFLLSRELLNLCTTRGAHALLVGTYAISRGFIFVSVRVVRTKDSSVVTGYDYELPNDAITQSMLK